MLNNASSRADAVHYANSYILDADIYWNVYDPFTKPFFQ